jgi:inosine-uridine nucleoside N-ribohydrolase
VPVCAGEATGCVEFYAQEYVNGYDRSISNDFTQSIKDIIDSFGVVTYVAIQGLSNPAKFLRKYPEYSKKVEVVHMGMTVKDARDEYIKGGTNMEADQMAAKFIYESGVSLKVVGSHTTINDALRVQPQTGLYKKLASSDTENHKMLLAHLHDYHERRKLWPALHDPLTLAVALGHNFVDFEETSVDINSEGLYKIGTGRTKIMISKTESKTEDFMDYCEKFV